MVRVQIDDLHHRIDMDTLAETSAPTLRLNEIGRARLQCHRALCFDDYQVNRTTGAFVLIDSLTNNTVGAGIIASQKTDSQDLDEVLKELRAGSALTPKTQVSPRERHEKMGQQGATVWLIGLPGSGRWSLAYALERRLFDLGRTATVIDPTKEDLRSMISSASACTDAGLVTICAFPSYRKADRDEIRARISDDQLVSVYVNTSPELCRERRPDASFEGFEAPDHPDVTVALDRATLDEAIALILEKIDSRLS